MKGAVKSTGSSPFPDRKGRRTLLPTYPIYHPFCPFLLPIPFIIPCIIPCSHPFYHPFPFFLFFSLFLFLIHNPLAHPWADTAGHESLCPTRDRVCADMATSLDTLSLSQLLDLAIRMPQKGAVHFAAMRKLLQAMLGHLDVQYLTTEKPWTGQLSGLSLADVAAEVKIIKKEMEVYKKHMRKDLDGITSASENIMNSQESQDFREEIDKIKMTQSHQSEKIRELSALVKNLEEEIQKLREDIAEWKEESSEEITQRLEALLQETKQELQKMEEQQEMRNAMLEQLVTETANQLNEQLIQTAKLVGNIQEEQEKKKADCTKCTFDINVHLGELLQRCEKLQEQVDSLESWQMAVGKLEKMIRKWGQDKQLRHHMDATVVQSQWDGEKLSFISGSLQKDSQHNQKSIEMLFQSLEKLQKEKADEQDMLAAMDGKADKAALGNKVNCNQFEENMERMHGRMQELQSQISGQKQHWNEVQQQLSIVVEEKLDRLALEAFTNQMEEMLKRSMEELEKKMMGGDSGAGIKKQLPVPFTCLSCDRMLNMQVPGQYPETLPYLQPLSPSKEPQYRQRRPVAHGSIPRLLQSYGDNQSSSSTLPPIQDSPRTKAFPQGFMTLPNKPRVTQLLGSGGHNSRDRDDQHPMVIWTRNEPGPASSREHRPATAPRHISWAPKPLQPRQISTAPK